MQQRKENNYERFEKPYQQNKREIKHIGTNAMNPAGNVMKEMQEAELSRITAGAGEARNSGGVLCTSTAECYYGTALKFCCPKG